MTELLCQTDSYLKEFDATITRVDAESRALILDRTAFFPGGGGQPADVGLLTVNGTEYSITKVKKKGADALHFIGGDSPLPEVGATVHGQIDWERRYQLMRT
ncbi:MAG: hypothetical protein B5M51_01600, partial [Anaerolinea sp. 4484_236]